MKIFIIRFSSIGDIIQCMSITQGIKEAHPNAEIHWITRKDLAPILRTDKDIHKIWELDRKAGFKGLINLGRQIRLNKPDVIYDAHLNLRSSVLKTLLCPWIFQLFGIGPKCVKRKKRRLYRFLYFSLGIKNAIEFPFKGMLSYQRPLLKHGLYKSTSEQKDWHFPNEIINSVDIMMMEYNLVNSKFITIIPSAAWELKRWPIEHWKALVKLMPQYKFVILAGPEDHFTSEIVDVEPSRVINMVGKTNLLQSFYFVFRSHVVVSADTGFLHAADLFRKPGIALMGPTAYGHPTGDTVKVLELDLPCRPCTKEGNATCKLQEVKKCLVDVRPKMVKAEVETILHNTIDSKSASI